MERPAQQSGAADGVTTGTGEWLVVYGSLMRGLSGPGSPSSSPGPARGGRDDEGARRAAEADLLDRLGVGVGLRRIGACRVPGLLFDLGPYPALRLAQTPADCVRAELHAILDPGVLAILDEFEGFDPQDHPGSDYVRQSIELLEPRGIRAWIYVYNREPGAERRIAGGDWRAHLAKRLDRPHDPD
jgi:gamma-glutamylcyclotransferase (GGCT)/AIG2-like uncharacterized protein YtfP